MVAIVSRTSRKGLSAGSWLANMSAGSVKPDHPGAQERVVVHLPRPHRHHLPRWSPVSWLPQMMGWK